MFPETYRQTPNVSKTAIVPSIVVLHHTSGSYNGSIEWCCDPKSQVSYHCIVARDGKRTVLAKPTQRTWHAGRSEWKGQKDTNSFSVGLAWDGDTYKTALSKEAIESAAEYLLPILKQFKIQVQNITRHANVAIPNGRKDDCSPDAHKAFLKEIQKLL
jgi:N-acetyl-anhydromuramyl-L-alanine amidase AmpD